jgi:large subunit ribosomal protein L23
MSDQQLLYAMIRRPLVTEKSTTIQDLCNQYTFEVAPTANKVELRKAVEILFKVKVEKVNIVSMPAKIRRSFGRPGRTRPWKKAIVTLAKGNVIEIT